MAGGQRSGYVLRSTTSVVTFWIGVVVLVVVVGAPLVRGDFGLFGFVLAPALLVAWLLWIVLYRPSIRYDAVGAVVTNIGRVHVLPWARVTAVTQRLNTTFVLDSGKRVDALGAPYPRRPGNISSSRARTEYDFGRNADSLDGYRRGAAPSSDPAVSRWDRIPLLIGLGIVVVNAIVVVVGLL